MNESTPSFGLVLVRIVAGAFMMLAAAAHFSNGYDESLVTNARAGWMEAPNLLVAWAENVVLAYPVPISHAIVFGELVLGGLLFLGLLTRPAGILAAILYAHAIYSVVPDRRPFCILMVAACLGCAISRAGRSAGGDVFADGKLPGWLTWVRS